MYQSISITSYNNKYYYLNVLFGYKYPSSVVISLTTLPTIYWFPVMPTRGMYCVGIPGILGIAVFFKGAWSGCKKS